MSEQHRNMILAIALSIAILLGFEALFPKPKPKQPPQGQAQTQQTGKDAPPPGAPPPSAATAPTAVPSPSSAPAAVPVPGGAPDIPAVPGGATPAPKGTQERAALLAASPRVRIENPRLYGTLSLKGGRIDDLTLGDYREELDPNSADITVLSPQGGSKAYFAQFGWTAGAGVKVPTDNTLWTASKGVLTQETPVTLTWDNGQGLVFSRTYAIDQNYMFTVTQRVRNTGNASVSLYPYGLLSRQGTPEVTGYVILHEGLIGVFDGKLEEIDYDEIQESRAIEKTTAGGWFGITDKYWLAALVPDQKARVKARMTHRLYNNDDKYQVDYIGGELAAAPGATVTNESHFFMGAKELSLLDAYAERLAIPLFDRAIDFGWLFFLTKPIFQILIYINGYVANYGLAILLLTVLIKLIFFPLANKSYVAMSKMKKLQPEMLKLRERFGEDKARLNQEMMALYKREKANPASGCLPIVIQIPVFFALYKVLFVTIEMRHAPFFGWVHDLSAADPTSIFNLFGLIPWEPALYIPPFLNIGVWPIIMGLTMFLQQKLNPQPPDPIQAKIFMFLPFVFTFMLAQFPAGLVIYWAWNNFLSILQQWVIMKRMGTA